VPPKVHQYLKFVQWEDLDSLYVGYCPDLFPWGGVCHGPSEKEVYLQLCAMVDAEVAELTTSGRDLPPVSTRPMREAVPV